LQQRAASSIPPATSPNRLSSLNALPTSSSSTAARRYQVTATPTHHTLKLQKDSRAAKQGFALKLNGLLATLSWHEKDANPFSWIGLSKQA